MIPEYNLFNMRILHPLLGLFVLKSGNNFIEGLPSVPIFGSQNMLLKVGRGEATSASFTDIAPPPHLLYIVVPQRSALLTVKIFYCLQSLSKDNFVCCIGYK
jgi:hypothetical protein